MNITYEYYSDKEGNHIIEPPKYPGTYYAKAFSTGTRNFEPGESAMQTIVIQKQPVFLSDLIIHEDGQVTGKAKNKEGQEVPGTFHIVDEESFLNLPAGTHQVKVEFIPDEEASRIYYGATGTAPYTVVPPEYDLLIEDTEKIYDGNPAEIEMHFMIDGVEAELPESVSTKYILRAHEDGENYMEGVPADAGDYLIYGIIEDGEYKDIYSNIGEILIHQAELNVKIPKGYSGEYDGKAVTFDSAVVMFGEKDVTKDVAVRYVYYSDEACTMETEPPVYPGTYYVKAFVDETRNFKAADSEAAKIVIEKRPVYLSELEIHDADSVTGKAKNKEGQEVPGTFHIVDEESFLNLPAGTHQVKVGFIPDEEASRIYYGATGMATYTVAPSEDPDGDKDPADGDNDPADGDKDPADEDNDPDAGDNDSDNANSDGVSEDDKPSPDDRDDVDSVPAEDGEGFSGHENVDKDGANDHNDDVNDDKSGNDEDSPITGDRNPIGAYLIFIAMVFTAAFWLAKKKNFDR